MRPHEECKDKYKGPVCNCEHGYKRKHGHCKNVNQVGFYRNLTYIEIFIYVRHSETLRIKFTYIRKMSSHFTCHISSCAMMLS
jgi:hypothetical protein